MMERISNCPNNRQRLELISDFRDVRKLRCFVPCTIGRKPIVLIHGRIIHPRGDEGNILFSYRRVSIDTSA
jgi:hypothetical protein